jgi:hypothetical protein
MTSQASIEHLLALRWDSAACQYRNKSAMQCRKSATGLAPYGVEAASVESAGSIPREFNVGFLDRERS